MSKLTTAGAIKRLASMTDRERAAFLRARSDEEIKDIHDASLTIASLAQDEDRSRYPID